MTSALIILTPGILAREPSFSDSPAARYLLLNPFIQKEWFTGCRSSVLSEDDFLSANDEEFNSAAKRMAHEWCHAPELRQVFTRRGLFLGDVPLRSVIYFFVGVVRAALILKRVAETGAASKWYLFDDGSYWSLLAKQIANQYGIQIESQSRAVAPSAVLHSPKTGAFRALAVLGLNFLQTAAQCFKNNSRDCILISGAFRFVSPWFRRGRQVVYLRAEFDLRNFKNYFRYGALHIAVAPKSKPEGCGVIASDWDLHICHFFETAKNFQIEGIDLRCAIKEKLSDLSRNQIDFAEQLVLEFNKLLQTHAPRAVLFDEEVCVFNKTLAKVCRSRNIPLFCQLHGVPFFDVSFTPTACDRILTWGESTAGRLKEWGVPEEKIALTGAPQYENWHHSAAPQFPGPGEPLSILMATQPFHTNQAPDFIGSFLTDQLIEDSIRFCAELLKRDPTIHLAVKLHPRDKNFKWNQKLVDAFPGDIKCRIRLYQKEDTRTLVLKSHLVLTMGSTVFYEAMLLKRPVFILDYHARRHTSFMHTDCLNLNKPEEAAFDFQKVCRASGWLAKELQSQQGNLRIHFHNLNETFDSDFQKLRASVAESIERI